LQPISATDLSGVITATDLINSQSSASASREFAARTNFEQETGGQGLALPRFGCPEYSNTLTQQT
jgi:hypothetical protein